MVNFNHRYQSKQKDSNTYWWHFKKSSQVFDLRESSNLLPCGCWKLIRTHKLTFSDANKIEICTWHSRRGRSIGSSIRSKVNLNKLLTPRRWFKKIMHVGNKCVFKCHASHKIWGLGRMTIEKKKNEMERVRN